jgi:CAAX prenyl protease-like protein
LSSRSLDGSDSLRDSANTRILIAYVGPFVFFLFLLAVQSYLRPLGVWEQPVWLLLLTVCIAITSRSVLTFRLTAPLGSLMVGAFVFGMWIVPDLLFPHYRQTILFQNALTGTLKGSLPAMLATPLALVSRSVRAIVFVPVLEELFWRGFLMRWWIDARFTTIPLGTYTPSSFWVTAVLFASEHGPFWDVGLMAGLAYNLWMIRTKSLGDCILAHAVTNGLLCWYVIQMKQWQYWQ